MTNPASQPRRLLQALVVLLSLSGMVFLLVLDQLVPAVGLGLVSVATLILASRPEGQSYP